MLSAETDVSFDVDDVLLVEMGVDPVVEVNVDVSSSDTDVYEDVNVLSLDKLEVGVVVEANVNVIVNEGVGVGVDDLLSAETDVSLDVEDGIDALFVEIG